MNKEKAKRIIFSGGGTAGPVSPLLAVAEEITSPQPSPSKGEEDKFEFLWIGTKNGPDKEMVTNENIEFKAITSGKLRRYFSWQNFIDPFKILVGFFQSIFIILKFKPDLVMSAGGFVSVPVIWAAWFLRVPVLIHQQDVRPGLANKLMAPFAKVITVTFEKSLGDYGKKAKWIGNPVRKSISHCHSERSEESRKSQRKRSFNLRFQDDKPVVLVVGGGTGAGAINDLVLKSLDELLGFCNIIHLTGKFKIKNEKLKMKNYLQYEFLNVNEMAEALNMADFVVSRAGLGLSTELSYLSKPTIFIPMPDTHQEDNAKIFQEKEAAIVLSQKELSKEDFIKNIKDLIQDKELQNKFSKNISKVIKKGANDEMIKVINNILK